MFKQAKQSRVYQDIIEQIEGAILEGKLKTGERLPSERALTELMGTSRGTLREALRVLEQKGLITIKTGVQGGPIVCEVPPTKVSESLALMIRSQRVSLDDLSEFREGVEGTVAALAAQRADKGEIKQLRELLHGAKNCFLYGIEQWDRFIDIDNKIHMTLAHIARNQLYELILDTVHDNISRYYDRFLERSEQIMQINFLDLEQIVQAVALGNESDAQRFAQAHVRRFSKLMKKGDKKE